MSKVPKKIQKLRNARLNAVQALYMYEQSDYSLYEVLNGFLNGDIGKEILDENLEDETETFIPILEGDAELLTLIINKFAENQEHIDTVVEGSFDERWAKDRIEMVLKNIIRAGATEIIYNPGLDIAIIIDEYVGLATSFYPETESKLVHAILHKIGATLR